MRYLKSGLIFDLNFFRHLDLYQVNKTLLKVTFTVFFCSLYLLPLSTFRKQQFSLDVEKFFWGTYNISEFIKKILKHTNNQE